VKYRVENRVHFENLDFSPDPAGSGRVYHRVEIGIFENLGFFTGFTPGSNWDF